MLIHQTTDNFYIQKLFLTNIRESRFDFFSNLCQGKKVLHIGCAEAMTYCKESNLHITLSKSASILHGMDIDATALQTLQQDCPGIYYSSTSQMIHEQYNLILVPEVMEHVLDIHSFLKDVFSIKSQSYFFTVPSIHVAQLICLDDFCLEGIHPDHKYWFSPYTLYKMMETFAGDKHIQMYYLENKSQIGICLQKG